MFCLNPMYILMYGLDTLFNQSSIFKILVLASTCVELFFPCTNLADRGLHVPVVSHLDMYCTNVLMYRMMVLLVRPTKVRR